MRAQQSAWPRFIVFIVLLLALVPAGAILAAAQSQPVAPAVFALGKSEGPAPVAGRAWVMTTLQSAPATFAEKASQFDASARLRACDGGNGTADHVVTLQDTHNLQGGSITKVVTPTGQVEYGDELTYTLVISAAPGVQVGLYDSLEGTAFTRFLARPTGIEHISGVITGTLTVTPTNQITVSFVAQVGVPGTLGWTVSVTNCACVYPFGGTLGGCVWSNEVTNQATRPCSIHLPLILHNYVPVQADFTAAPTSGPAPLTVVFTNTSTGGYTASLWGFGDGITSTQTSPTHTYTTPGAYTATLTVSGPGGMDTLARPNYITASAPQSCVEGIANGSFEDDDDWVIPITEYPAAYTTVVTRSGNRSMRVGILEPGDNRESYSSARQTVTVPANTISATLRFWLYSVSGEPPANLTLPAHPPAATIQEAALPGDIQYVLILNEYDQWINTLVWQRRNDQAWIFHEFDLGAYAGRNIKLHFGAYNDGWSGVTGLYVDDVSLEICAPTAYARLSQGRFVTGVSDAYWNWIRLHKPPEEEVR